MSGIPGNPVAPDRPMPDALSALERQLDPKGGLRTLARGILFFRVGALIWMIVLNLVSGGFARPWLAYLSLGAAAAWTAWLVWHPQDQHLTWALMLDLALSAYLVLVSAYVVPPHGVIASNRLFFATAYPVSTPLMWGMSRGVGGGLGSALVISVALALTRPLNSVHYRVLSDVVSVANGSAYFFMAGGTVGVIRDALDRSAKSLGRAVAVAMEEQDRARWADTVRDLHDSVLQGLGYIKRQLRELVDDGDHHGLQIENALDVAAGDALKSELRELAGFAAREEQDLRDWINIERGQAPVGFANLGDRLKETRRRVTGLEVTVNSVGQIRLPDGVASELCAAVEQALENVKDHAQTDRAFVFVEIEDGSVLTSIRDPGCGFHYDPDRPQPDHIGLRNMRQRAEGLGGRMKVISAPGLGTTIEFLIPMKPEWTGT